MSKLSYSLHEYLYSLKNMHISNNYLNENWGFFVDIETNPKKIQLPHRKNYYKFNPSLTNRISSYKSVSNLNQLKDTHNIDKEAIIFKMDEDIEYDEYNSEKKNNDNKEGVKNLNFIGNMCIISSIAVLLLLL